MKKLKVGIFMDDYYPSINGVIMVMHDYAKRLVLKDNVEVTVVVPYIDKNYVDDFPYKVIRVKSAKLGPIGYSMAMPTLDPKVEKKLLDEKFDIIHIHSPFVMGKLGVRIAEKLKIPVIGTMHTQFDLDIKKITKSDTITKLLIKDIMKTFNACDKCFAVNGKVAEIFNDYGAKEMPGVQHNGTDLELTNDKLVSAEIVNKKFGIEKDEIVFLFVGRLTILKNILFIVDVLNELKNDFKFKMLFVGPDEDREVLEKKIRDCKLEDKIILTGKITDRQLMKDIYSRADLFLFPSLYDCSSLVQIEASSQMTPTVFIEGAATANTVTNNVNGFLAPNDVLLFAERIKEILEDKELYDKVSQGSYRDLYKRWDDLTDELCVIYMKIINEHKEKLLI